MTLNAILIVRMITRVLLILSVAVVGVAALSSVSRLMSTSFNADPRRNVAPEPVANVPPALTGEFVRQPGFWTFPGWGWRLSQARVSTAECQAMFECFGKERVKQKHTKGFESPEAGDLIAAIQLIAQKTQLSDTTQVYAVSTGGTRLNVVTYGTDGDEVVLAGLGAFQQGSDQWQLIELHRSEQIVTNAGHLLPLPSEGQRLCVRESPEGSIQIELVRSDSTGAQLLQWWRSQSWKVTSVSRSGGNEFSYICTKDEETVHVWCPRSAESPMTLVLTKGVANNSD